MGWVDPPEGDLKPKQGKEISMQEVGMGWATKAGFWFRVLRSERGKGLSRGGGGGGPSS